MEMGYAGGDDEEDHRAQHRHQLMVGRRPLGEPSPTSPHRGCDGLVTTWIERVQGSDPGSWPLSAGPR